MTAFLSFGHLLLIFAGWFTLAVLAVLVFHCLFGRKIPKQQVDYPQAHEAVGEITQERLRREAAVQRNRERMALLEKRRAS